MPIYKLKDLKPDPNNFNRHTDTGMSLLEKSVDEVGVIESITVSNDNQIISGNARHEVISRKLAKEPITIETDGTTPIIIKRTDIESGTAEFTKAAILANTVSVKNIDLDLSKIEEYAVTEMGIDVEELGVELGNETANNPKKPTEINFTPYNKTHVLLSFHPKVLLLIGDLLEEIKSIDGVEYETSSN